MRCLGRRSAAPARQVPHPCCPCVSGAASDTRGAGWFGWRRCSPPCTSERLWVRQEEGWRCQVARYPRNDSNTRLRLQRPVLSPLSYGSVRTPSENVWTAPQGDAGRGVGTAQELRAVARGLSGRSQQFGSGRVWCGPLPEPKESSRIKFPLSTMVAIARQARRSGSCFLTTPKQVSKGKARFCGSRWRSPGSCLSFAHVLRG